jgi:hypothetical protein
VGTGKDLVDFGVNISGGTIVPPILDSGNSLGTNTPPVNVSSYPEKGFNPPFKRDSSLVALNATFGEVLLVYGGQETSFTEKTIPSNDLYMFHTTTQVWTVLNLANLVQPTARFAHSAVVVTSGSTPLMCVYGGILSTMKSTVCLLVSY